VKAVVFTTLPAAIALLLIPDVAVRLLFGDSEIDVGQLSIMSIVLSIYSLSLLPMALVGVVMRRFYAMSDATSALKLTGLWVVLWVVLDLILIPPFGIYGLAVAAVSAVWLALLSVLVVKGWEPWLAEWPAALLSRETLVISVSSVITVGIAAVVFRHFVVALAVASLPLIFAAYIVLSAIGGSSLARDVVRVATRPKDVS
jgi:peptidoglycan biosynthesis protein MviN/MurJ (putative lipid II flippase)